MTKKINLLFALLVFSTGLAACTDEEKDTEKPVIEVTSPADHAHFHPGDVIHFDAEFSDNLGLKQFKIDIHWGGEHDHKSVMNSGNDNDWSYEYIGDLLGRNQRIHMDITIPADAKHGDYHFLVYATDLAGNEAFIALEIEVDNDDH